MYANVYTVLYKSMRSLYFDKYINLNDELPYHKIVHLITCKYIVNT